MLVSFDAQTVLFWFYVLGVSLAVGSFLNVLIIRLPVMLERAWQRECQLFLNAKQLNVNDVAGNKKIDAAGSSEKTLYNLFVPRSHCPHCQTQLRIRDNIPVLSFFLLRGRCAHCQSKIAWQYPIVELLTVLLSLAVAFYFGMSWQLIPALLFTWILIALASIDINTQLLPDQIVLPGMWLGLLFNSQNLFVSSSSAVIGAVVGYGVLWIVYQVHHALTKREGLGYGDFKLAALLGAWLGWQVLPLIILFAAILGLLGGIALITFKDHQAAKGFAFGPYLAISGWVALLWGPALLKFYLGILS